MARRHGRSVQGSKPTGRGGGTPQKLLRILRHFHDQHGLNPARCDLPPRTDATNTQQHCWGTNGEAGRRWGGCGRSGRKRLGPYGVPPVAIILLESLSRARVAPQLKRTYSARANVVIARVFAERSASFRQENRKSRCAVSPQGSSR